MADKLEQAFVLIPLVYNPFPVLLLVTAVAVLFLATQIARRIPAPGTRSITSVLVLCAFWTTVDACLHLFPGNEYFLTKLSYIPTVLGPVMIFFIALDYRSQLNLFSPRQVAAVLTIPAITIVMAFTDEYHHLLWSKFDTSRVDGLVHMEVLYGAWFYVHITYSYLANIVASILLLSRMVGSTSIHRGQVVSLCLAILLPWVANFVYLLRLPPTGSLDITSAAFAGSCILLTLGILFYRLFDVVPIAHDAVVQQMRDCVIILDPDGRVLDANPASERTFGVGRKLAGRFAELYFRPASGPFRSLDEFKSAGSDEVSMHQAGQPVRYFDLTVSPLLVDGKRLVGRTVVLRDITVRRREQEALLASREETAAANLRLSALNDELRAAFQRVEALAGEAEAANRVKSEFLAAMSHEIRTPMNAVLGAADLLEETGLSEPQREFTGMIRSAGSTLLSIINDILDLSKAEAGRMELADEPFNVIAVMDQVNELVDEQVHRKLLRLEVDVAPDFHPWLRGDGSRFRQVLLNLVSNAVKFTDAGRVCVRVAPLRDREGVRLEVEDTGIGVPEESRSRLFEVFRQADASMSRRFGGTGLGLAIARRLVELMQGTIGFSSTPGHGSTFWFEVPLRQAPAQAGPSRLLLPLRAVVVASAATSRLLALHLRALGFTVDEYPDTAQAEATLEAGNILLVEDVNSPDSHAAINVSVRGRADYVRLGRPVRLAQLTARLSTLLPDFGVGLRPTTLAGEIDPEWAGRHVLVAEDNAVNAKLARILLDRAGLNVEVVSTGEEAVAAFRMRSWDLILMDLQMPDMDGLEATRQIRALELALGLVRTPVCALTANVLSQEREQCTAAGMDDFVAKPIERAEILRVLRHWVLTKSKAAGAAASTV